jgi:hypothetical protein
LDRYHNESREDALEEPGKLVGFVGHLDHGSHQVGADVLPARERAGASGSRFKLGQLVFRRSQLCLNLLSQGNDLIELDTLGNRLGAVPGLPFQLADDSLGRANLILTTCQELLDSSPALFNQ